MPRRPWACLSGSLGRSLPSPRNKVGGLLTGCRGHRAAAPLLLVLGRAVLGSGCSCTGVGFGSEGLARGFPENYGTACQAWDDGVCSAHACGSLETCDELWPDSQVGTWCCRKWCYVDPSTCTLADVQPTTQSGMSQQLYYSYDACESWGSYDAATCPWQAVISFEEAYNAILVTERIGELLAHSDEGHADLAITELPVGGEIAITAGKDAKICVFKLRVYGGHRTFCTPEDADPVASIAATPDWVATVTEGHKDIAFWEVVDGSDPSLNLLGRLPDAGPQPLMYLKYLQGIGLLGAREDGYVSVWPVNNVNATINGTEATTGSLGPFTWVPKALEKVTFWHEVGVACASYADIEIWVQVGGNWTRWTRLSGHSRLVTSLSFLPSLGLLASASLDSNVGLWKFEWGEWKLASLLYDHSKPVKALAWVPGPLLASGDEESLILWRPVDKPLCEFSYTRAYYLPGFNRYELAPKSAEFCRQACCENPWCTSFDYAHRGDGQTHGDSTCWLSSAAEGKNGGSGLQWDSTANYDYYEITKRGSRFMTLEQPKGVSGLALASKSLLLLSGNDEDGVVDVWKLSSSSCPDGQMAKGDGASCTLCPLGRAGISGSCPSCRPGTIADQEGLTQCESCPKGRYNAGVGGLECFDCAAGRYADAVGTDQCTMCPLGRASSRVAATQASACEECGKGQYAHQLGSSSCTSCGAGTTHDLYAMKSPEVCTRCDYCGHERGGGIEGPCPVPKSNPQCEDCPSGTVVSARGSCEYCPLGEFPTATSAATSCGRFGIGAFDAVPDINDRLCYARGSYPDFKCPLTEAGGWGTEGRPDDDDTKKHLDLTADENGVCSGLVCMGAFYELAEIVVRQKGISCPSDQSLLDLCDWSLARLNEDIGEREAEARAAEGASELKQRQDKLVEVVNGCKELCEEVTEREDAMEDAFDILPFVPTQCTVAGLTVYYTCASERPAKSVEGTRSGLTYGDVSEIVVQRTTLPRCEAQCRTCPTLDSRYRADSFEPCNSMGDDGFPVWAAVLIAVASALLLGAVAFCVIRRCRGRRMTPGA